jgi:membrane dipeptidase
MRRDLCFCFLGVLFLFASRLGSLPPQNLKERALKIHQTAIVVDTHADTPQRMLDEDFDLDHRDAEGAIDIPRMKEGGLDATFQSIWVTVQSQGAPAVERALRLIDAVREQARLHPDKLILATTVEDIRQAKRQGKIALLMGLEGGHMINNDLRLLRTYRALGVRYMTLTHGKNTDWADSSTDAPSHNGLTDFGKAVVREMNRLGMMVDISHVSDKTFYDAIAVSKAPVIASHSSCRAINSHPRNMSDDMIRALARNGGVMQINFYAGFLNQRYLEEYRKRREEFDKRREEIEAKYPDDLKKRAEELRRISAENHRSLPAVPWTEIVDHIDHVVKLVGVDYVGLGSDFDGADMPSGMEDASRLPLLTEELLRRGYSEQDIKKILGGNLLRVMSEVQRVSQLESVRR